MESTYTFVPDLMAQEIPADGILSRTLYDDERAKVVLFAFAAGQELSEHTASMPAVLHQLRGEARWTLGADAMQVTAGAWVLMPPQLPHSIRTETPVLMLLTLLKGR